MYNSKQCFIFVAVVQLHMSAKVLIISNKTMTTEILKLTLPPVLPHGWITEVAGTLGIHRNTVTNAINLGKGETYDRIMKCAKEKYGKPIKQSTL